MQCARGHYAAAASILRALPWCGSKCSETQVEVDLAAWVSYSGGHAAVRQAEPGSADMPSPPRRETRERELLSAYGQLGDANEVLNERAVAVMKRMSDKLGGRDFLQVKPPPFSMCVIAACAIVYALWVMGCQWNSSDCCSVFVVALLHSVAEFPAWAIG